MRFRATVELGGTDDVVTGLGTVRRPAVHVTVAGHRYRSTIAPMGGRSFIRHVLAVEGAEAAETRARLVAKVAEDLRGR